MMSIYVSAIRSDNDAGAFFEADEDAAFFYIMDMNEADGAKIRKAIKIAHIPGWLNERDVDVKISADQDVVALFIEGEIAAAFDFHVGSSFVLDPICNGQVEVPDWVTRRFRVH